MKRILLTVCILLCVLFGGKVNAEQIKIACIGNSITAGPFNYPSILDRMLGDEFTVGNFGVSGRTCLMTGDCPYMNEDAYQNALAFLPDIVVIKLGTNDSKYFNWNTSQNGELYKNDLTTLINSFKELETNPRIIVCVPTPAFSSAYDISNSVLRDYIDPIIREVAESTGSEVVDLNTPLLPYGSYFGDGIHPDEYGADLIAREIYQGITGNTFEESNYLEGLQVDSQKFYSLVNKGTGKILDSNNTSLILSESVAGSTSQRFVFEFCGYGAYKVKQYSSGNYLRTYGNSDSRIGGLDSWSYDFAIVFYPTDIPGEYLCGKDSNRLFGYNPANSKIESNHTRSDYTDYDIWYIQEVPVSRLPLDSEIEKMETLVNKILQNTGYTLYSEEAIETLQTVLDKGRDAIITDLPELNDAMSELNDGINKFYQTISLEDGVYLFKRAKIETYWLNLGTHKNNVSYTEEKPTFRVLQENPKDQLFSITKQRNGRFKIESLSDVPAYINEGAKIRRDLHSFSQDWNTFHLISDGEFWAVQPTGWGASAGFWIINNAVVQHSERTSLNLDTDFIFDFIPYNPNSITSIADSNVYVFVSDNKLNVRNTLSGQITVFNVNGTKVINEKIEGDFTKELSSGFYVVKLVVEGNQYVAKVMIK